MPETRDRPALASLPAYNPQGSEVASDPRSCRELVSESFPGNRGLTLPHEEGRRGLVPGVDRSRRSHHGAAETISHLALRVDGQPVDRNSRPVDRRVNHRSVGDDD